MYQFFVLATFTDHVRADTICGALEQMQIPVMMEHVRISEDKKHASMIRVMVPSEFIQRASAILNGFDAPMVANLH
ncbi:MAG: hypothetical protein SGJ02_03385 [bacterium]|nr:hypothetical protein [bacterium]